MEVYTLDSLYRRERVIDQFESLIWTERYALAGDFKLSIHSTPESRTLLSPGTNLAINESYRMMQVETVEDSTDSDGKKLLTVEGRSFEKILEDRVARPSLNNSTLQPNWYLYYPPAEVARKLFNEICVLGILDPGDIIPGVIEGTIFPEGTIPEPPDTVLWEVAPMSLYQALAEVCAVYDLGFRLVRNFDTSQLYFDVYTGSDRTTAQDDLPAVIFSPDLDNLQNTTELTTIALAKNVAFVLSPVGQEYVYPPDVDPDIEGFERRVLLVKADDITDTDPLDATARMVQRGNEELSRHRAFSAFDGEIDQTSEYKYGIHYNLGDLIEKRNVDGITMNMRVTEQIFVCDEAGERSYPTLSINSFITPGSWLSWGFNQVWEDMGETEYWDNQP